MGVRQVGRYVVCVRAEGWFGKINKLNRKIIQFVWERSMMIVLGSGKRRERGRERERR